MSIMLKRWARLYEGTRSEIALEPAVASLGVRYRFQHPLWALGLFPDFVLLDDRLVIEVDDPSHRLSTRSVKDRDRTRVLEGSGWRVVRCTNDEAVRDPYGTVDRLMARADLPYRTRPPTTPVSDLPESRALTGEECWSETPVTRKKPRK